MSRMNAGESSPATTAVPVTRTPRNFGAAAKRSMSFVQPSSPSGSRPTTPITHRWSRATSSSHWLSSTHGLASTTTVCVTPAGSASASQSGGSTRR